MRHLRDARPVLSDGDNTVPFELRISLDQWWVKVTDIVCALEETIFYGQDSKDTKLGWYLVKDRALTTWTNSSCQQTLRFKEGCILLRQLEINMFQKKKKKTEKKHQASFTKVVKFILFHFPDGVPHQFLHVFKLSCCFFECQGQAYPICPLTLPNGWFHPSDEREKLEHDPSWVVT